MANTVQLKKDGQIVYPVTDVSLIIGLQDAIKLPPIKTTTLPYVFVDYSASCVDTIDIGTEYNGKPVSVVESRNATAKADVYNNGIDVVASYVNGETCFIVLAIG
jgi:hypothetical protein